MNMWKYDTKQAMTLFPALAPTLILAGDIGDPDEPTLYRILDMTVRRYKNVIYVPGNHEFYLREPNSKKTPASVLAWFKTLEEKWPNFHFLYRQTEVIDGVPRLRGGKIINISSTLEHDNSCGFIFSALSATI